MTTIPLRDEVATLASARLGAFESQEIFRTLLLTMSKPGTIGLLPLPVVARIDAVVVPLLALLGHATPFAMVGPEENFLTAIVARVTGGLPVSLDKAAFVAFTASPTPAQLAELRTGTKERPDTAAQIVVSSDWFSNQNSEQGCSVYKFTGPGVDGSSYLYFDDDHKALRDHLIHRNTKSVRGFDVWFVQDSGPVAAIARTTQVQVKLAEELEQ